MTHHWKNLLMLAPLTLALAWALKSAQTPQSQPSASTSQPARTNWPSALPGKGQAVERKWHSLLDDSLTAQRRLLITDHIRADISVAEVNFLFSALDHTPSAGAEEPWWIIMNEIMERLRKQGLGADQYAARLSKIAADSQRPEVVRDYAIQHLLQWVAPSDSTTIPGEPSPAIRAQTLALVAGIIRDPSLRHSSIPGTALLALADATSRLPTAEAIACWDELDAFLAPLVAGGSDASLSLQGSAIQAAALTYRTEHMPAIFRLAKNETADPSLRLTSIAALAVCRT